MRSAWAWWWIIPCMKRDVGLGVRRGSGSFASSSAESVRVGWPGRPGLDDVRRELARRLRLDLLAAPPPLHAASARPAIAAAAHAAAPLIVPQRDVAHGHGRV